MKLMFPVFKRTQHCANVLHLNNDLTCTRILAHNASALLYEKADFDFRTVGTNILGILIMSKDRLKKRRRSTVANNWLVQIKLLLSTS